MDKSFMIISRETGEIVGEFTNEKSITAAIRDFILPEKPQWLSEMTVHVVTDHDAIAYSLYDFAVQTRVIKGKVKK